MMNLKSALENLSSMPLPELEDLDWLIRKEWQDTIDNYCLNLGWTLTEVTQYLEAAELEYKFRKETLT